MGRSSAPWRSTGNEPRGRRVTRCVALARAVRRDATASRRACPRSALAFKGSPSNAPPGCRGHEGLRWSRSDAPRPGRSRHRVPRPSPRATRSHALPVQASRLWPPSARHGTPGRPFGLRGNDRLHEPRSVEPVVEWCGPPRQSARAPPLFGLCAPGIALALGLRQSETQGLVRGVLLTRVDRQLDALVLNLRELPAQLRILDDHGKEIGAALVAHSVPYHTHPGAAGLSQLAERHHPGQRGPRPRIPAARCTMALYRSTDSLRRSPRRAPACRRGTSHRWPSRRRLRDAAGGRNGKRGA